MYDLIIRNGMIVDGTGSPGYRADVAIRDGVIAKIGQIAEDTTAGKEIDATDCVVAPGFIDIHTHSDLPLVVDGLAQGKVRQGVTTEVVGNCGFSMAPIHSQMGQQELEKKLADYELDLTPWETMDEYLRVLEERGVSINVVPLIGHGTVRKSVMDYDQRLGTEGELARMCQLVRESMEAGAFGLTSGLIYPPSCYADTAELVQLSKVVAEYGGFYATHMRNESDQVYQAVEESIEIGRQAGLPVQISHHKVCHPAYWGDVEKTLQLMHRVREEEGLDVTCDVYPYLATATGLSAVIPEEYHAGGTEQLLQNLADPEIRPILLETLETTQGPRGWHNLYISGVESEGNRGAEGRHIQELAKARGVTPAQMVIDILLEEKLAVGMIRFAMCEEDVTRVIQDELTMIGSDGGALATEGILAKGKPHPRNFGTFPRVLGKYSRDEGAISLEQAVQKMTSLPAQRLGLVKKGFLQEGHDADLTIFQPDRVKDRADFQNPFQYPEGIPYVIVNGSLVIDQEEHTGRKPGKVLRKKRR